MELASGGEFPDMKAPMKLTSLSLLVLVFTLLAGCKPKAPEVTDLQRKEAANLVSEAQFAITLRDLARAEPLLAKAAQLAPDTAEYWVNLGAIRRRMDNKSGAKQAYEQALKAYRADQDDKKDEIRIEGILQEVHVLALLGRADDARTRLEKALKKEPENRILKRFAEDRQLDRMLEDPGFKDVAL